MAVTKAHINPKVLAWARKRLFPTVEAASGPLKVSAKRLEKWERGEDSPTFGQARKMADRLRIPFGYFYLNGPPPEEPFPLPDLRNEAGAPPSIDLLEVIHDAHRKQSWYREEMQYQERSPLSFVGRFGIESSHRDIAEDICVTIGIDQDMRREAASWQSFLAGLVQQTEDAGVLVLRSGVAAGNTHRKLHIAEFRGFALPDPLAPIVFVNAQDSTVAQIFTLAHELAHIWIGESGLCNPDFRSDSDDYKYSIERLCHNVATEVLRTEVDFLRYVVEHSWPSENSYWKWYGSKPAELVNVRKGWNYLNPIMVRNSRRFTESLIAAIPAERAELLEAAELLNVRGPVVDLLCQHLYGVSLRDA